MLLKDGVLGGLFRILTLLLPRSNDLLDLQHLVGLLLSDFHALLLLLLLLYKLLLLFNDFLDGFLFNFLSLFLLLLLLFLGLLSLLLGFLVNRLLIVLLLNICLVVRQESVCYVGHDVRAIGILHIHLLQGLVE